MKFRILLQHYDDDSTLMPGAVAIIDEHSLDNMGEEWWEDEKKRCEESHGPGTYREVIVAVPDGMIEAVFKTPEFLTSAVWPA